MKSVSSTMVRAVMTTTYCTFNSASTSYYVWAEYDGAGANDIEIEGFYILKS